jgi:hypothetical protein
VTAFKCKACGGNIQANEGAVHGVCDSCGVTSTLPKGNEDRLVSLFNRANHFRMHKEFDRALGTYDSILSEDITNAEAHWCIVLCRYGIVYEDDPQTHEKIPTCLRVQNTSILSDVDYLAAIEHAPDEYSRDIYKTEAEKINEIQKGILAISKSEKPYDIFISYKETTPGGSRTKDSVRAQEIYQELTKEGYRVFYSKISLEDKVGQQWEPYIFNALNSAKVMLVIGTCKEHFESVWVKNEWSRYLALMKDGGHSRLLIPCYQDMDAYDIPDELANLQAQDMGKIGFAQDLIRGIKKILDVGEIRELDDSQKDYIPIAFTSEKQVKRYETLLERKRTATTEQEFRVLAKSFTSMQGLGDTPELAKECLRIADEINCRNNVSEFDMSPV